MIQASTSPDSAAQIRMLLTHSHLGGMRREKEESPGPWKKVSNVGIGEEHGRKCRDSLHAQFLVVNVY